MVLSYGIEFDKAKNDWLRENRGICFDDILPLIEEGLWLGIVPHPSQAKYPGQRMFILEIDGECYAIPFVVDETKRMLFLKTLYPSRKLRKIFFKERDK